MVLSGVKTAIARARFLKLCLKVDSSANMWFQNLDPAVQVDWDQLKAIFAQCWAQCATPIAMGMRK